ncbi:fungal-specific transcription factor domain-containing protein [Diplocarpon rosae]|nr:fungal-specific transcription factor domain-containing protein [Diplocarpon rosae]
MPTSSNTPPDDYFNHLSRPTCNSNTRLNKAAQSPPEDENTVAGHASGADSNVPKPKRIACVICRKRKLKCDGTKPSCSTCSRLGHSCAYDEVRRKSGPKRGYVKALEERLSMLGFLLLLGITYAERPEANEPPPSEQVENLLKTQDPVAAVLEVPTNFTLGEGNASGIGPGALPAGDFNISNASIDIVNGAQADRWGFNGESPQPVIDHMAFSTANLNLSMGLDANSFTWEMIGLGLEEPLPPQETIDELFRHDIYFEKIHPSVPMIHKYRYLAAMNLAPSQRPPVALRYAMWTLAASVVDKFVDLKNHFYHRARKYMEADTLKGHGEHIISVAHAQTHALLAQYEFKMMSFPRAWMSTGSAIRICQMMGLHRLDGAGLDVKQCLPVPRDWTEREERSRTFWFCFCADRYASIGTGWPMVIDEKDIQTDMPSSDEAFNMSMQERTNSLQESMSPSGASKLSPFGSVVLMACLFGRNLTHLHRPDSDGRDGDINGEFWKRHRKIDNILLNTSLSMPSHLKLPNGIANPNIVFANMNIHTSTICLHQAAIYKAEKNHLPSSIGAGSKVRCITAANEISNIMRMVYHMDLSSMNPFVCFCLYVAARVFVQYLKSRPDDYQTGDSLRFLMSAMNTLKNKNPLTESFLVQLDVDLKGLKIRNPKYKSVFAYSEDNLGISSSKMPKIGQGPNGLPNTFRNLQGECNFVRIMNDNGNVMDDTSPAGAIYEQNGSHRDSAGVFKPQSDDFGETNWMRLPDHAPTETSNQARQNSNALAIGDTRGTIAYGQDDLNSSGYIIGESSNAADTGLSPSTARSSSIRPTPNASTASDSRSNLQPGNSGSEHASYETSSTSILPERLSGTGSRTMQAFVADQPGYSNIPTTTSTPNNAFVMPETPGRDFDLPAGWEMSNQPATGLTPVGEGLFRQLLGLGAMDAMDVTWEGGS